MVFYQLIFLILKYETNFKETHISQDHNKFPNSILFLSQQKKMEAGEMEQPENPRKGLDLLHLYLMVDSTLQYFMYFINPIALLTVFHQTVPVAHTQFIRAHCFVALCFQKCFPILRVLCIFGRRLTSYYDFYSSPNEFSIKMTFRLNFH